MSEAARQQPAAKAKAEPEAKALRCSPKTVNEQFRKDLASCDSFSGDEKKDCRRETFAARDEGLYSG